MKKRRYFLSLVLIFAMVAVGQITGQNAVIYPAFVALAIGGLIANRQPWFVSKNKILILPTICAIAGIVIVRYCQMPLIIKILEAFMFSGVVLIISKSNFLPAITTCVLPVFLDIKSILYPISVAVLACVIIACQWLLEYERLKPRHKYTKYKFDIKIEIEKWSKLLALVGLISFLPIESHHLCCIIPPLMVIFAELSTANSKFRKNPIKLFTLLTTSAFIGWGARFLFNVYLGLPIDFSAA